MKSLYTLVVATLCMLTMAAINPQPVSAFIQENAEETERRDRGAENRADQEARRANQEREGASRRATMPPDSARKALRDSLRAERGNRPDDRVRGERPDRERPERERREGPQVDPEERAARQEQQGSRENMRTIRGTDRSPEELRVQLSEAKAQEMSRHESRMAQIEQIHVHAEQNANENAIERINRLVEKENALHEKKMNKLLQLENKLGRKMLGERPTSDDSGHMEGGEEKKEDDEEAEEEKEDPSI